jgi:hypothetical protein
MISADGFQKAYDRLRGDERFSCGEEIFEHLNSDYESAFGAPRYASFNSFKSSVSQRKNIKPHNTVQNHTTK